LRTVKSIYLEIVQNVDPKTEDQAVITEGTVGTVDGESFSKEDILNFYNRARMITLSRLRQLQLYPLFVESIPEVIDTVSEDLSLHGDPPPHYIFEHPEGYVRHIGLMGPGEKPGFIIPKSHKFSLISGSDPYYDITRFAFAIEEEDGFHIYYQPAEGAEKFHIMYVKLEPHTIADVTGGTKVESINPEYHHVIISVAGAIANERGGVDPEALALRLLGGGQ